MSEPDSPSDASGGASTWLRAPAGVADVEVRLPATAPPNVKQAVDNLIAVLQQEGAGVVQAKQQCSYIKVDPCDVYVICRIVD